MFKYICSMPEAKKYEVGQIFKSTRFDDESFYVSDIKHITKETKTGKVSVTGSSYEISYIPDVVVKDMPSGSKWVHERGPFVSNDELIHKEIALGNWIELT